MNALSARTTAVNASPDITALIFERCALRLRLEGIQQVALFPAGRFSHELGTTFLVDAGLIPVCYVDDEQSGDLHGIPITHSDRIPSDIDAVIICSYAHESKLAEIARSWAHGAITRVIEPFASAPSCSRSSSPAEIDRLLQCHTRKLNFGCGNNPIEGWTNIDGGDGAWWSAPQHPEVINLDVFNACEAMPDSSCTHIYSEHFFEHFTIDEGSRLLESWRRILIPGGTVRIVTPDLNREARMYLGEQLPIDNRTYMAHKRRWIGDRHSEVCSRFITPAMHMNFGMRLDGHKFLYDFETIKELLEHAGFSKVTRCAFGESTKQELAGIEHHDGGETGGTWTHEIQLCVEAEAN